MQHESLDECNGMCAAGILALLTNCTEKHPHMPGVVNVRVSGEAEWKLWPPDMEGAPCMLMHLYAYVWLYCRTGHDKSDPHQAEKRRRALHTTAVVWLFSCMHMCM
jgi:hypothetical protein